MTITIKLDDIIDALELGNDEGQYFLNTETGTVVFTSPYTDFDEDAPDLEGVYHIEIPPLSSRTAYRDMEQFIETVADEQLRHRLEQAIQGRRVFRRFKDTLAQDLAEQKRWFAFKQERLAEHALEWLKREGIKAKIIIQ